MDDKFGEEQKVEEESAPQEPVSTQDSTQESQDNFETPKPFGPDPDPEPEPEPQSYAPLPSRKKSPVKLLLFVVGAIVVILVLFNGVKFVASKFQKSEPSPTPTPVSVETSTPSATEEASASPSSSPTETPTPTSNPVDSATGLDRSKLNVEVQNGSGVSGAGAKAATFLKNLGYNITSTGNADNFNYANVTIQVKSSQQSYLPLLNKDLSTSYSVGSTSADLSATSSADALVIIGK